MAIDLKKLSKPTADRPMICTLFGEGGMGKTTLAAMFPAPVFIRTEDGTTSLVGNDDVALFDLATSSQEVLDQITALQTQDHDFKTLVIDSITQLAIMIEAEIVAGSRAKSIVQANGGYGAGYTAAAERHREVRKAAGDLAYEKGMNIVFIGHAFTETLDLPDLAPFGRYTVRLHKLVIPNYIDNVDMVALIRLQMFTKTEGDKSKGLSTGKREIICFPQAVSVTKNRYSISEPIPFDFGLGNPFEQFVAK